MKNTLTQRLVMGLLALFLLSYVGYQAWRYFTSQYKTETVYTYTVAETAGITGIALREEQLLDDWIGKGVATYLTSDGTKVSNGTAIAEVYRSEKDAENVRMVRELSHQREQLEKAQDPGTTSYAHTDVLNRQIFSELGGIIRQVDGNSFSQISGGADNLLLLLNTKQVATGKQSSFAGEIERLESEERYYSSQIKEEPETITAPRPGYFIRTIDGLEGKADLENLDELLPDDLARLMNTPVKTNSTRVGKLMLGHNWYFAAAVPEEDVSKYREGALVTLDFHLSGTSPVEAVVWNVNKDQEKGGAVVVFRSDYINEALVNLRTAQADVKFKSISGLRVSSSAIRFEGIQKGVYIIRGEKLAFRPVDVLYEGAGFVVCREANPEAEPDCLQQYDDVVIEGAQRYDGKPA